MATIDGRHNQYKFKILTEYEKRKPLKSTQYYDEQMLAQIEAIHAYAHISGVVSITAINNKTRKVVYEWQKANTGTSVQ